jgi:hypothetical protein
MKIGLLLNSINLKNHHPCSRSNLMPKKKRDDPRTPKKQAEFQARPNVVARRKQVEREHPVATVVAKAKSLWERVKAFVKS